MNRSARWRVTSLIMTVARRLNSRIRSNEICAVLAAMNLRFLCIWAMTVARIRSTRIAQRLTEAFVEPCQLSNLEIQVECAVAAAVGEGGARRPDGHPAPRANCPETRESPRKSFELYATGGVDTARRRFSMETDLRRALATRRTRTALPAAGGSGNWDAAQRLRSAGTLAASRSWCDFAGRFHSRLLKKAD